MKTKEHHIVSGKSFSVIGRILHFFTIFTDVYVAAALMEYFCTKDKKVASNIFELGFKRYKDKVGYVTHYLDFLIHLNDDNNTRVLFERVLSADTLPANDAKKVWTQFMEFEATVGDLSSIKKVEKRVLASMTVSPSLKELLA